MRSEQATASATATPLRKLEAAAETRARVTQARLDWIDGAVTGAALMAGISAHLAWWIVFDLDASPILVVGAHGPLLLGIALAFDTWPRAEATA